MESKPATKTKTVYRVRTDVLCVTILLCVTFTVYWRMAFDNEVKKLQLEHRKEIIIDSVQRADYRDLHGERFNY